MEQKQFFEPKHFSRTDILREVLALQKEIHIVELYVSAHQQDKALSKLAEILECLVKMGQKV
jgi:hypothetical protein